MPNPAQAIIEDGRQRSARLHPLLLQAAELMDRLSDAFGHTHGFDAPQQAKLYELANACRETADFLAPVINEEAAILVIGNPPPGRA